MEELRPGAPLDDLVRAGIDDVATTVLCDVIEAMLDVTPPTAGVGGAQAWGEGFTRYLASGDTQLAKRTVERAHAAYDELCATQSAVRLLHGDLQHTNVRSAGSRGWRAIDPKGVVAELAFELGPVFRNPPETPAAYTRPAIERRARTFAARLDLDVDRILGWAFSQAVLSAIWTVEDEGRLLPANPAVQVFSALDGRA
jgi:streptomycin 6-kinase